MDSSDDRARWALLIGIDQYPKFAPHGQLRGCVNDVQVMRQVLTESFSFPADHITVLLDGEATREGILAAMQALVQQAREGDVVVFHYSGHGSQMTDVEGDEPDGLDETIVPYDSGRTPHENRDIKDDEIYLWLRELTTKTSAVTLIFDCCHSGTIVRTFEETVRWVDADLRLPAELPPSPIPLASRASLDGARDLGPSGWLPLGERYVLLAGCSRFEKSYEIEEPAGVRHGALTFFLAQALRNSVSGATYRDVFEVTAPRVSSRFPNQHPQLEGARDLEVFGVRWIAPIPFVPVVARSGDTAVLGAGAACGLSEGSQWAIYARGMVAIQPGDEPCGIVSLTRVRAVTSEARIVHESRPGGVQAGMRAVEQVHALETRMAVQVVSLLGKTADVEALLKGIGESTLLRPASMEESARARVYLLPVRSRVTCDAPLPDLGPLNEDTWAAVGKNGELVMPTHRRGRPGVTQLLVENLEKVARFQLTLGLGNPGSALTGKVKAELFRWVGGALTRPQLDPGGEEVFYEGDQLVLRVVHEHSQPLFIYVLDLGLTGRIRLVYPVVGAEESLPPGRLLDVGKREGEEMCLYIPEEFPFLSPAAEAVEGHETLKIFATTRPTDFYPLFQPPVRGAETAPRGPACSLADLLSVTFGGGGYRDSRPLQRGESEDWIALERSFRLRRPLSGRMAAGGRSA